MAQSITHTPPTSTRSRGFTLVELLVLLVVMTMLIAMSGTALMKYLPRADLKYAARTIASLCQHARMEAIKRNAKVEVRFSGNTCTVNLAEDGTLLRLFSLSEIKRGGISFGKGSAVKKPNSNDNITGVLPQNGRFSFKPRGGASLGTVYIQNTANHCMAVRVQSMSGSIRTWSWDGNSWK